MPAYAERSDLENYLLPAALQNVPTAVQDYQLAAASGFADGFLSGQFKLPLVAPYPADLVMAVCKIAAYWLMLRRGFNPDAPGDVGFRAGYDDAVRWLGLVRDGEVTPQVIDSSTGAAAGDSAFTPQVYTSSQRGFSSRGESETGPFEGD